MSFHTFQELFIYQLRDLYDAENQILEALPQIIKSSSSPELKQALKDHFRETEAQVERLLTIFNYLEVDPEGQHCFGMEGLIHEANEIIQIPGKSAVKDAAIIGAAQKIEHYEVAGYGTVHSHAEYLDFKEAAILLQETLNEEGAADKKLTKIAEGTLFSTGINKEALKITASAGTEEKPSSRPKRRR